MCQSLAAIRSIASSIRASAEAKSPPVFSRHSLSRASPLRCRICEKLSIFGFRSVACKYRVHRRSRAAFSAVLAWFFSGGGSGSGSGGFDERTEGSLRKEDEDEEHCGPASVGQCGAASFRHDSGNEVAMPD